METRQELKSSLLTTSEGNVLFKAYVYRPTYLLNIWKIEWTFSNSFGPYMLQAVLHVKQSNPKPSTAFSKVRVCSSLIYIREILVFDLLPTVPVVYFPATTCKQLCR